MEGLFKPIGPASPLVPFSPLGPSCPGMPSVPWIKESLLTFISFYQPCHSRHWLCNWKWYRKFRMHREWCQIRKDFPLRNYSKILFSKTYWQTGITTFTFRSSLTLCTLQAVDESANVIAVLNKGYQIHSTSNYNLPSCHPNRVVPIMEIFRHFTNCIYSFEFSERSKFGRIEMELRIPKQKPDRNLEVEERDKVPCQIVTDMHRYLVE